MSWLDGTMIANAKDAAGRVETLFYLLKERYQLHSKEAGDKLKQDYSNHLGVQALLVEVRVALQAKDRPMNLGRLASDSEVRQYLTDVLAQYDSAPI